jgi:hypothetical protein
MPTRSPSSIAERLNTAKLAIQNSLADTEIQTLVAGYGYPATRLNEGKTLYDAALLAVSAHKSAEGSQKQTTQDLEKAENSARDAYQALAQVARAVFKEDRARLTALGLQGSAPESTAGFLAAAAALFDNAGSAPTLASHGYVAARLTSERAKIAAFDLANQKQEAAKGATQQASREQLAALTTLDAWRAQYIKIARVALRGKPQLLEKIGVIARTTRSSAQRSSAKKVVA